MFEHAKDLIQLVRDLYPNKDVVHLHEPLFPGSERKYVNDCIDTTMVSSVGEYVTRIEMMLAKISGRKYAVSTSCGTSALHLALKISGVQPNDLVITQALTFVATANAISHCGASPVFLDVDRKNLSLSPAALTRFFENECKFEAGRVIHKASGRRVAAVLPVYVLGHVSSILELKQLCERFQLPIVEDAAEALGSYVGSSLDKKHAGSFGQIGVFSFNGNKIVTTGGGGALVMDDEKLFTQAKKMATTAKLNHPWDFDHDEIAYNYRMPNLNAALGCAQLEQLEAFVKDKRAISSRYSGFCSERGIEFLNEPEGSTSNYWLNAIVCKDLAERDRTLTLFHENKILARPFWKLMSNIKIYAGCIRDDLTNSQWLQDRVICLPSGVRGSL